MKCGECECLMKHNDGNYICSYFFPAIETTKDNECFAGSVKTSGTLWGNLFINGKPFINCDYEDGE